MELHDYETQARLETLVDKATARRLQSLEPSLVADIKALCKASDANVRSTFELIFDRLRQPHSQVRLLALQLCAELFQRSSSFRSLLAARFPQFLELAVGFRLEAPLPPPAPAAAALRERALELVERWSADHGVRYRQVSLGHDYLRDTLKLEFPEVDARRAEAVAEEAGRQARAARAAQERYAKLVEEWPAQAQEWRSLLRQLDEAFFILEGQEAHAGQGPADGGEQGWEDVEEGLPATAAGEVEGLAAYGFAETSELPAGLPIAAAAAAPVPCDTVVETLEALHKAVVNAALPGVQAALRTLVRAEVGEEGHAQRDRLLRSATELREGLAAADQRYAAAQLDLTALVHARQRRADAELMGALFGPDSDDEAAGRSAGGRDDEGGQAQALPNPYDSIRDPAAPRHNTLQPPMRGHEPAVQRPLPPATGVARSSRLPDALRKALAAQAPVLPAGAYAQVWDSSSAPVYASSHALEVSNHWGPVDVHQELPAERLDELFMVAARACPLLRQPQQQQQRRQHAPPGRRVPSRVIARPERALAGATAAAVPVLPPAGSDPRARRAAERAYNDAAIAANSNDEALARALQDAEEGGSGAAQKKRRASKVPARERLQKKLLSGRAAAAALSESAHAERELQREKFGNRWEHK